MMLPHGNLAKRRDGSLGLGTLSRQDALGTGATDAIDLRGIGERGFLMMLVLRSQDGGLARMLIGFFGFGYGDSMALPVQQNRQAHGAKSRKKPCHDHSPSHSGCKGTKSREQNKRNSFLFCQNEEVSLNKVKNIATLRPPALTPQEAAPNTGLPVFRFIR